MQQKNSVPWWLKTVVFVMLGLGVCAAVVLVMSILERRAHLRQIEDRLTRAGYEKIENLTDLVITNPPTKPTWYIAKSVTLLNGSLAPIAMYCATSTISGTVCGDVLFVGIPLTHPALIIQPGAILQSNLETTCWMLKNFGELRGQRLGTCYFYVTNRTPLTTGSATP